jgi:hypothetical protein
VPTRLSLYLHLLLDVLERRYRTAQDTVARSHWQMIWLLAQGSTSAQVAVVTGDTINGVRRIAQRDNPHGPEGLGDRRHRHPGRLGRLSAAPRATRVAALEPPPPDGGVWTGPKAAAWMAAMLGHRVHA